MVSVVLLRKKRLHNFLENPFHGILDYLSQNFFSEPKAPAPKWGFSTLLTIIQKNKVTCISQNISLTGCLVVVYVNPWKMQSCRCTPSLSKWNTHANYSNKKPEIFCQHNVLLLDLMIHKVFFLITWIRMMMCWVLSPEWWNVTGCATNQSQDHGNNRDSIQVQEPSFQVSKFSLHSSYRNNIRIFNMLSP